MTDNLSLPPSTVAPMDSASSNGKKKKPGKAERAAKRSQVGTAPSVPASASKASIFASGVSEPRPQPGKYPVVFQTGAGEPSRDQNFAIDGGVAVRNLTGFPGRFTANPKYAQFKAHSEISDDSFQNHVVTSGLLRLAQQVVHSHVNMGLPQGDFAPVASSDVRVPSSVSAFISQYGEHSVPALGTRFLYAGYEDTVKWLIWLADQTDKEGASGIASRWWLPMGPHDMRTRTIIAARLRDLLSNAEIAVSPNTLEEGVLSGEVPDAWEGIKDFLGDEPEEGQPDRRDRFDFLFKAYGSAEQLFQTFSSNSSIRVLAEIDLHWLSPSAGHLNWQYNAKEAFTRLADKWAKLSPAYAQFFELSAGQATRTSASGSQSQMVRVTSVEGVTVVKTYLALSAPEFSLAACFPPTCVYSGGLQRNVVVTTPLSVVQRATEFAQLDWR
jgi:hypothetical protein